MDQKRDQPQGPGNQISSNARGQQQSKPQWDGRERRSGASDRRQPSGTQSADRNTPADVRLMNEGSSR